jgi:hypothetical protein
LFIGITTFLKPELHLDSHHKFYIDWATINEKFLMLQPFTPYFGFTLGILAYSTALSQMTIVPELLIVYDNPSILNATVINKKNFSPEYDYFRLPLFLATFFALFFKICFGLAGAIAW